MRCTRTIRSHTTGRLRRCRRGQVHDLVVCWQHVPKAPPPIGPHYLPALRSAIFAMASDGTPFIEVP
jgi:hypothetical protein